MSFNLAIFFELSIVVVVGIVHFVHPWRVGGVVHSWRVDGVVHGCLVGIRLVIFHFCQLGRRIKEHKGVWIWGGDAVGVAIIVIGRYIGRVVISVIVRVDGVVAVVIGIGLRVIVIVTLWIKQLWIKCVKIVAVAIRKL